MSVHVAVAVSVTVRNRWQVDDLAVSHPSFGDYVVSEFLHVFTGSLQDRDLHATFVITSSRPPAAPVTNTVLYAAR
jgi:hypothetical protein